MNKRLIIFFVILVFIFSVIFGITVYNVKTNDKFIAEQKVNDGCIGENEEVAKVDNEIEVSSTTEKVYPNAQLIIKKHYKQCGHIIEENVELLAEMVNKTQEEIEQEYKEYKLESFASNRIVLIKEEEGICNEHYILKSRDGVIVIYNLDENQKESLLETTSISIEYLPETDKINLNKGIEVYGKQELNSFLEDFE